MDTSRQVKDAAPLRPVRVWDLPTRLFHWLLVGAVVGLAITGQIGGGALQWHFRLGYLVLALLVFRLLWGLAGGRWSRFGSFVHGPATILRHLRGQSAADELHHVGHNPLGALSVLAMLWLLAVQVACGLVADDEIANVGPLNHLVSSNVAALATGWHKGPGKLLLIALIVLHVGAIVFYRVRHRKNLVRPMITGDKPLPAGTPSSADGPPQRLLALLIAALCAGAVAWLVQF